MSEVYEPSFHLWQNSGVLFALSVEICNSVSLLFTILLRTTHVLRVILGNMSISMTRVSLSLFLKFQYRMDLGKLLEHLSKRLIYFDHLILLKISLLAVIILLSKKKGCLHL